MSQMNDDTSQLAIDATAQNLRNAGRFTPRYIQSRMTGHSLAA
jgi:hypothetical protein